MTHRTGISAPKTAQKLSNTIIPELKILWQSSAMCHWTVLNPTLTVKIYDLDFMLLRTVKFLVYVFLREKLGYANKIEKSCLKTSVKQLV